VQYEGVLRCGEGLVIGVNTHKKEGKTKIMLDKRAAGMPMYTLKWQRFKKEIPEAIITGAS
jgi:hypothetical protein